MKLTAFNACRNWEDAEEAAQDAMLAAHRGLSRWRGDAALGTWLRGVVVNACRDQRRRRDVRARAEDEHRAGLFEPPRDPSRTLHDMLQCLCPDQRIAVFVVNIAGFSVQEAARLLAVPPGTVKSRCARGRRTVL